MLLLFLKTTEGKSNEEQDTQTNHKRKRVHTGHKRI